MKAPCTIEVQTAGGDAPEGAACQAGAALTRHCQAGAGGPTQEPLPVQDAQQGTRSTHLYMKSHRISYLCDRCLLLQRNFQAVCSSHSAMASWAWRRVSHFSCNRTACSRRMEALLPGHNNMAGLHSLRTCCVSFRSTRAFSACSLFWPVFPSRPLTFSSERHEIAWFGWNSTLFSSRTCAAHALLHQRQD